MSRALPQETVDRPSIAAQAALTLNAIVQSFAYTQHILTYYATL